MFMSDRQILQGEFTDPVMQFVGRRPGTAVIADAAWAKDIGSCRSDVSLGALS